MPLRTSRGSTQDTVTGVPVAAVVNEDGSGDIQAVCSVSSVTNWPETARAGISGPDAPAGGNVTATGFGSANLVDKGNAQGVQFRATCSLAGATLTGRPVWYSADATAACLGFGSILTFASDPTLRLGDGTGDFICVVQFQDALAARRVGFLVDSVSGGSWTIYLRPV